MRQSLLTDRVSDRVSDGAGNRAGNRAGGRAALPPLVCPRTRTVPAAEIVEMLLLCGWAVEVAAGAGAPTQAAVLGELAEWGRHGLGFAVQGGIRLYDPAEVMNFLIWAGVTGAQDFWATRFAKTGQAMAAALPGPGQQFRMTLRRWFPQNSHPPGRMARLRLPVPLTAQMILPILPEGAAATARAGGLDVQLAWPAAGGVGIGVDFAFTPMTGQTGRLSAEDAQLYRRGAEQFIRVTPAVAALAGRLAGGAGGRRAVMAFWDYLIGSMVQGMMRYGEIPAGREMEWVLAHGWYDCQLGAALLVSLCRARGIPARMVSGYLLYLLAPTPHFWAEAWFEESGWTPYDLLSWDFSRGGQDETWRNRFAGQVDARAVMQILPRQCTGPMHAPFPPHWRMLQKPAAQGVETTYSNAVNGALLYREQVAVAPVDG